MSHEASEPDSLQVPPFGRREAVRSSRSPVPSCCGMMPLALAQWQLLLNNHSVAYSSTWHFCHFVVLMLIACRQTSTVMAVTRFWFQHMAQSFRQAPSTLHAKTPCHVLMHVNQSTMCRVSSPSICALLQQEPACNMWLAMRKANCYTC